MTIDGGYVFRRLIRRLSILAISFFTAVISTFPAIADDPKPSDDHFVGEEFKNPPAGYGEVPFWWWTGDKLNVERLKEQIDELALKGVSGVQVNYAHQDVRNEKQPNWLTYPNDPEIFTDEWFNIFEEVAAHCREKGMGIGLSGYTLDWQHSPGNFFDRLIYKDSDIQSRTLYVAGRVPFEKGDVYADLLTKASRGNDNDALIQFVAYPFASDGKLDVEKCVALGNDLDALDRALKADADKGEAWIFRAKREPQTLNPLHPESGKRVVERFFEPFQTRAKAALGNDGDDGGDLGLNYFFQDELQLGTGELVWNDDLASEFETRKGYPYWVALPAMFNVDVGKRTEKYRLDYMDVRVRLAEERYFIPIYNWHAERGRIYACDPGSRGRNPSEFCDYFSAIRWYTAPGHDTPGGRADFIKNKVSSSIAHFYRRPRVWLEGYHSFGWGATPERLLFATNENFLFGANLLNLHGLYYTTYGGRWEWAPPCYHFRQPYWETFGSFLKYFERLSYALTRGVEQTDFVVLYPVCSYQSRLGGDRSRDVAFDAATRVFNSGRDVLFIDDDSIARSQVKDGRLCVSGGAHRVLILPGTRGVRFSTLAKALELYRSGGVVVALDAVPETSDRDGRDDPELIAITREIFGGTPDELSKRGSSTTSNERGGIGAFFSNVQERDASTADPDAKVGSQGTVSYLRRYDGGFEGRWVWYSEPRKNVYFKWIASGLGKEARDFDARFFCDNSGTLYVNGAEICRDVDYSTGWRGKLSLRDGDVVTVDGVDADAPRRGSAGMFFALVADGRTATTAEDFRCAVALPDDETERSRWRTSSDGYDKLASTDVGNTHVLHRTGVNSEAGGEAARARDDESMRRRFEEFLTDFERDVYDVNAGTPCVATRRSTSDADIFFVMRGRKNARLSFRSRGRAEIYNSWDGSSRTVPTFVDAENDRSELIWPYEESEAGLVVFWKNEEPTLATTDDSNAKSEETVLSLDGEWDFELMPTLNNRWGDFRLPVAEDVIGAEAQRFDLLDEKGDVVAKDRLNDFGVKFMELGPFPNDADLELLEAKIATLDKVAAGDPVVWKGREYRWRPYEFSWRFGVEGNPGRQGYHGLKEKIDSRFIALGKAAEAHNETIYTTEDDGDVYYLWSRVEVVVADRDNPLGRVDIYTSGGAPSAIYVGGERIDALKDFKLTISDNDCGTPTLLRYDGAGRRACAFVMGGRGSDAKSEIVAFDGLDDGAFNGLSTGEREEPCKLTREPRTPLSTIWFDIPGVLDYDVYGCESEPRRVSLRFIAPPGLSEMTIPTHGKVVSVFCDGKEARARRSSVELTGIDFWRGRRERTSQYDEDEGVSRLSDRPTRMEKYQFEQPFERAIEVVVTIEESRGVYGAAVCPEPIRLKTARGVATLGDWNERGVLADYSGGARYGKTIRVNEKMRSARRVALDLGRVGASCRVRVNGRVVADVPAPPWRVDITECLKDVDEARIEIDVYNTLANFYRNIPSRYKNGAPSGLIGPVQLRIE